MTPQAYKTLITNKYLEITKANYWHLPDEQFQMFTDSAVTFGSGETILNMWEEWLLKGNTDIKGFFSWCVDVYLEGEK